MTSPRRILAVDDDPVFLRILQDLLAGAGFNFRGVRDPMRTVPEAIGFDPQLVLMDRNMPVLNGTEVARSLRAFPQTAGIPVAFLMGDANPKDELRALRAGAVDVMAKPLTTLHVARITALLTELAGRAPDRAATPLEVLARDLLALHRRERREGTLLFNPGTPFEGRVQFKAGELFNAEYGPLTGMAALLEMLGIEDAAWRFEGGLRQPEKKATFTRPPTPAPRDPSPGATESLTPRLLFVDDEQSIRRLFSVHFSRTGFQVQLAHDGQEAYELAASIPFEVIVADLNMPRLDGWGMLKLLKADHRTREVPVIFLSAQDSYRETLKVARAGAHDYLAKTGHADLVVERALALLSPRSELLGGLQGGKVEVPVDLTPVGAQWLLRTLAKVGASGTLSVRDEWGEYILTVSGGDPRGATASSGARNSSGMPAVAALFVSRWATGRFVTGKPERKADLEPSMERLIQTTCDALNRIEARVTSSKLASTPSFVIDEVLYELFRKVGSDRSLLLARAVCEQRMSVWELPARLGLEPDEVQEGLKDLLRRGVIRFPD